MQVFPFTSQQSLIFLLIMLPCIFIHHLKSGLPPLEARLLVLVTSSALDKIFFSLTEFGVHEKSTGQEGQRLPPFPSKAPPASQELTFVICFPFQIFSEPVVMLFCLFYKDFFVYVCVYEGHSSTSS